MKNADAKIKYILDNFDFKRVRETMKPLKWTWAGETGTPSINALRDTALDLLMRASASKEKHYFISTGGLKASKWRGWLQLEFVVTDYHSEGYNRD